MATDLVYYWYPTGSRSVGAMAGGPVRFCLHTTEGAQDIWSITGFIQGNNGVSYHAAVDNINRNRCHEFVLETDGAWAQCSANSSTLCLVMCTPGGASASWSADYWWNQQSLMMHNAAQWLADQSAQWGIPLIELTSAEAQGSKRGVCQHKNLGSWGCSHSDCGNLPMGKLLALAQEYAAGGGAEAGGPAEPPAATVKEDHMGAIGADPISGLPVPAGATKLVVGADVRKQGVNHVKIDCRFHYTGEGDRWQEDTADLVVERPSKTYSLNARDQVSMEMQDPALRATYTFS